jgi:hypothetical protein
VKLRRVITMGQACMERGNSKFYRILEERTFWKMPTWKIKKKW